MKIVFVTVLSVFVFIPFFFGMFHISPFSESVNTNYSPWAIGFVTGLAVDVLLLFVTGLACLAWSMIVHTNSEPAEYEDDDEEV